MDNVEICKHYHRPISQREHTKQENDNPQIVKNANATCPEIKLNTDLQDISNNVQQMDTPKKYAS